MKKSLSKAVALAATIGAAASVQAVSLNHDGIGQVLLYPVYTVENGNDTYIHVTNTTDQYKAVKVRFVEGMNSQEVLDFNLYLSPQDVWTGAVVATADGAKLVTSDKSCTAGVVPAEGLAFRNFIYGQGANADAAEFRGLDRSRVGHLEIIEMGVVDPALVLSNGVSAQQAIEHVNGVPGNCGAVRAAFSGAGAWASNLNNGVGAPTGGLYGSLAVINVQEGTEVGSDATALDGFSPVAIHAKPGDLAPSLTQAEAFAAFPGFEVDYTRGIDAVSATLMKSSISNDYAYGAGLNAETDFVITFPTKTHYVNAPTVVAPFTQTWNKTTAKACEPIAVTFYDREERSQVLEEEQISPRPPVAEGIALCHETNILSIGANSEVLGGKYVQATFDLPAGFETGWINVNFTGTGRTLAGTLAVVGGGAVSQNGLPAIGFAVTSIQNGDVGGLLSNYAVSNGHKAVSLIPQ